MTRGRLSVGFRYCSHPSAPVVRVCARLVRGGREGGKKKKRRGRRGRVDVEKINWEKKGGELFRCRRNHSQRGLFRQPRLRRSSRPRSRRWYLSSYKFSVFVNRRGERFDSSFRMTCFDVLFVRRCQHRDYSRGSGGRRWRSRSQNRLAEKVRHAPVGDWRARIEAKEERALVKAPDAKTSRERRLHEIRRKEGK